MTFEAWRAHHQSGWLFAPLALGNAAVVGLAAPWALRSLSHDPQVPLLFAAGGLTALLALLWRTRRRIPTFRALLELRAPTSAANRLVALRELSVLPGAVGRGSFVTWAVLSPLLGLGLVLFNDASLVVLGRLTLMGLLLGPLAAALASLLVTNRCFDARDALAVGLPQREVVNAAVRSGWGVRRYAVVLATLLVLTPLLACLDLTAAALRAGPTEAGRADFVLHLAATAVLAVLFALITARAAGRSIAGPLRRLVSEAETLANGELGEPRNIAADGETWRVTSVFSLLHERLAWLVKKVVHAGRDVAGSTTLVSRSSRRFEATAAEQAAALGQTNATTEELARSARQIATSAASVEDLAVRTREAARTGALDAAAFLASVERMKQDNASIAQAVVRLRSRVQQIGRIVELINTVADRSDLLALSAELEGTRAGEAGRGFALVGAEMRRLAENVLESTAEVEELISEIRDATVRTSEATERGSALTGRGAALALEVTQALDKVADLAQRTADSTRDITQATRHQEVGTNQLAESMADVLAGTQQELAITQRLGEVNGKLVTLTTTLHSVVTRFTGRGER